MNEAFDKLRFWFFEIFEVIKRIGRFTIRWIDGWVLRVRFGSVNNTIS